MINHYETCTPNYPEKPENEKPRQVTSLDIGEGVTVYACVDCGAFELTEVTV